MDLGEDGGDGLEGGVIPRTRGGPTIGREMRNLSERALASLDHSERVALLRTLSQVRRNLT